MSVGFLQVFLPNESFLGPWCDKTKYLRTCFSLILLHLAKKEKRPVKGMVVWSMHFVLVLSILKYWKPAVLE